MKQINRDYLEKTHGIVVPQVTGFLEQSDYALAMDAQSPLVTVSNAGIPAFLTNYLDPEAVNILVTPNRAAEILGEMIKGDWTTQTAMFPVVENTGEVSSYGDYSNAGFADVNYNFVNRQSYLFETITQWGELELETAGQAKMNLAAQKNISSVMLLDKFLNKSYFFGIAGLENYGLLNDPSLSAPVTPLVKAAGGTTWAVATAEEVFNDIATKLYPQLIAQTRGRVNRDDPMVLALAPEIEANFTKTNQYNVNVTDQLKKNFPNLRIVSAVEYATTGGQLVQLIAEAIDGQKVGECAFNEKLRAHPVKIELSSYKQKKTTGTWGSIIKMPIGIAGMIGV